MGHVFISYSRKDAEFVDRLANDLRNAGVNVWRDIDDIAPGEDWAGNIKDAVTKANVFLYVASKDSIHSQWMNREVAIALQMGITVIPVIIDDDGAGNLPTDLRRIQWLDFRKNYNAALSELIKALPKLSKSEDVKEAQNGSPKSKGYVFISFAEEDSDFVKELRNALSDRGYGYWDYQNSDRDYHTLLFLELESIIKEASATLSVLSPDWKKSQWAAKEYLFSQDVGTPVFLLMYRDMGPTLVTAGQPYIDFTKSKEDGFAKLDRELKRKGLI